MFPDNRNGMKSPSRCSGKSYSFPPDSPEGFDQRMTRRDFLKLSAGASVTLGGLHLFTGCENEPHITPTTRTSPTSLALTSARVSAIRGRDLYEMTRQALEAVGGAEAVVRPGEKVFIKPNLMAVGMFKDPFPIGWSTKTEIVIVVAEECLKAGASEVVIGDGAQVPRWSWESVTTLDKATNLAAAAQELSVTYGRSVTLACLEVDTPEWVEIDASVEIEPGSNKMAVSSHFYHADCVISIPVLRTHPWTQLTLSMKNMLGVTPLSRYGTAIMRNQLHEAYADAGGIEQCFIDIAKARKPDLAILDASIGVEGLYNTVDMRNRLGDWLLLVGTDPVAVDATAARIVKHDVNVVEQLGMAFEQGLGQIHEDLIDVSGACLDELCVDWLHSLHVDEWRPGIPAETSAYGKSPWGGSVMINYLAPFLLPLGMVFFLKNTVNSKTP